MSLSPLAYEEVEWASQYFEAGGSPADIVRLLLADSYAPCAVVRSLVEGVGLTIPAATTLVGAALDTTRAIHFEDVWSDAEQRSGESADDVVLAIERTRSLGPEMTESEMDLSEALEIIGVDRLTQLGETDESLRWFRSALVRYRLRGSLAVVVRALDRLGCPADLVPDLFAAACAADASDCRLPIAAVIRTHGVATVAIERDRLAASLDPNNELAASKWSYWLRADWGHR